MWLLNEQLYLQFIYSLLLLVVFCLVTSYVLLFASHTAGYNSRAPPGPPGGLPILGHLLMLRKLPFRAFFDFSCTYGPIFSIRLGSLPAIVVSSSSMAKEVLFTHDLHFSNRLPMEASKRLFYGIKCVLCMDYGPRWKELRKLYAHEILSAQRLEALKHIRSQEMLMALQEMEARYSREGDFAVHLNTLVYNIAANTMGRMLIGKRLCGTDLKGSQLKDMTNELTRLFAAPVIGDFVPYLKWLDIGGYKAQMTALHKRLDAFLDECISDRLVEVQKSVDVGSGTTPRDFLDVLLEIHMIKPAGESPPAKLISDMDEVKASILEMLLGGMETTSTTTEWGMVELIRHPHVMKKLQEELDRVVGKDRELVEETDFPELLYTQAVVQETLRLHPAFPLIMRRANPTPCQVAGYTIQPNSILMVNLWAIGREASVWERPHEFWPERFQQGQPHANTNAKGQYFELLPFSTGRRGCPGMNLALSMFTLMLANLVHSFDWSCSYSTLLPLHKNSPEQLEAALDEDITGITAAIPKPIHVIPTPRRQYYTRSSALMP